MADRGHLLRNLREVAERVFPGVSIPPLPVEVTAPGEAACAAPQPNDRETRQDAEQRQRQQRRQAPTTKTKSIHAVASRLGIDGRSVLRYLGAPECPQPKRRGKRSSLLGHYRYYIVARLAEGCHNATELYRESVRRGYPIGITIVKDLVGTLRSRKRGEPVILHIRKRLRRWFNCPPEQLRGREHRFLNLG